MKKFNRKLSGLLVLLMVFTMFPAEVFGLSGLTELQSKQISLNDQLNLYSGTYYNSSISAKASENYMIYEPGSEITPLIAYGNDIYGAAGITRIFELEEAAGKNIVAATNGDYFTMATGVSLGTAVKEGVIRTGEHSIYETLGFFENGIAKIGRLNLSVNFLDEDTGATFTKMVYNKVLTQVCGVVLYTGDFGGTNEVTVPTRNVIIDIESGEATPDGIITGTVVEVVDATTPIALNDDQLVLSIATSTPYASALTAINAMQENDTVTVEFAVDPEWEDVQNAIGVERRLISDGKIETFTDVTRAPRTAAGIKADGSVVIYTVDGRQSTYSMGMTYAELAARMKELGCVEAVNLDGGDSTMMFATYPGYETNEQVNQASGTTLRRCGNYILFENNQTPGTSIKHLHVYPYGQVILAGSSMDVTVKATDANYFYLDAPTSGLTYGVSSGTLGTVSAEGVFTAGSKAATGNINAKYNGITGSASVTVVSAPDSVALVAPSTQAELPETISISAGETFQLSAAAIYKMLSIISDESGYHWEVTGNIGTIDETGLFTATTTGLGTGTITVTAGARSDSIAVTIVTEGKALETFEDEDKLIFETGTFENIAAEIETDLKYVHNGEQSLKLDYSYDNASATTTTEGAITGITEIAVPMNIEFTGKNPTMFTAWIYGDGSNNEVRLAVTTPEGLKTITFETLDFDGWQQAVVQLPKGVSELDDLSILTPENSNGSGTIYIDQIMAGFGYYLDNEAPSVNGTVGSQILAGAVTDNLDSEIAQSDIQVTYDGQPYGFTYNAQSKSIAAHLPDGDGLVHRVVIKVTDESGNIGRVGITEMSEAPDEDFEKVQVFSDMDDTHWASLYAEYLYSQDIITGKLSGEERFYDPDKTMTRQEFAAVIVRWLGIDVKDYEDTALNFADNAKIQDWAQDSVRAALSMGFMTGKAITGSSKVNFDPTGPISRQEVMTVIGRAQEKGYAEATMDFQDAAKIAAWALPYVKTLVGQGVISGFEGKLDPTGSVTRGQVAKIIFELN